MILFSKSTSVSWLPESGRSGNFRIDHTNKFFMPSADLGMDRGFPSKKQDINAHQELMEQSAMFSNMNENDEDRMNRTGYGLRTLKPLVF